MGTVTISGNSYDVYGDEAGFKEYMAGRIGASDYDDADNSDRKKALVSATRWLDRQKWQGDPTDTVTPQPLEWPRTGLEDKNGVAVDDSTVPDDVQEACYELALVLLGDATKQDSLSSGSNLKRVQAEGVQVEWFKGTLEDSSALPVQAHNLVKYWLDGQGGFTGAWSGDSDSESSFDEADGYGFTEGMA